MNFANTYIDMAPGADIFKVEVVAVEATKTRAENDRMRLKLRVVEGARTGTTFVNHTIRTGLNRANTGDPKKDSMMMDFWMKCLCSLGYSAEDLREHGDFKWDNIPAEGKFESLKGKVGFMSFKPADPENGQQWSKDWWITESQYNAAAGAQAEVVEATASSDDPLSQMLND